MTPTMVYGCPLNRIVRPRTDGSDPNRVRHSGCARTTVRGAPARSSTNDNARPRSGRASTTSKKVPDTAAYSIVTGGSLSRIADQFVELTPATPSRVVLAVLQFRISAYDTSHGDA